MVLALVVNVHGQDRILDSLRNALDTTRQDTVQLRTLVSISQIASLSSRDTAYARPMARMIAKLEQDPHPSVKAVAEEAKFHWLLWRGAMRLRVSDYRGAVRLYNEAGRLATERADTARILDYEVAMGDLYGRINDTVNGLRWGYRAFEHALMLGDSAFAVRILLGLGESDTTHARFRSSLDFIDAYASTARWQHEPSYHMFRGRLLQTHGEHAQAIAEMELADSLFQGTGDRRNALNAWFLGGAYQSAGRSSDAIAAFHNSLKASKHFGIRGWHAGCALDLGKELRNTGDPAGAEAAWRDALEQARLGNFPDHLSNALDHLKDLYTEQRRYREALELTAEWLALKDSSNAEEARRELLQLEFGAEQRADSLQFALEREEASRRLAKERTQRKVLIGFGAFALVFAAVDYRRRRRIKKEHARSEALLLNILPQEVATELKAKGHADAKHFEKVTILFTDFKGFTSVSEQLSPAELVEELNTCFKAFDGIITARGIEKIKTIGDAYMCAGGLPTPNTTHATDVINAAFEMRDFIAEGKAHKIAASLPYFEIRIGIHTGPVVAGIVGVKKFQYDIWGDTVNTASRMESSGEVGQVNISEATYALVKDVKKVREVNGEWSIVNGGSTHSPTPDHHSPATAHSPFTNSHSPAFAFTPRGKVQAKGKGEMEMYFVQRSSGTSDSAPTSTGT